jgi:transglutaminase-like putative cysteine protease
MAKKIGLASPGTPAAKKLALAPSKLAPTDPEKLPEPWLATLLRMFVYFVTAGVFAWPLTVPESALGAACAAALASVAGRALAGTTLRTWVIAIGSLLALCTSVFLSDVIVGSEGFAGVVGPAIALRFGEVFAFGAGAFTLGAGVRAASARHRSSAMLESAFIALAFGALVVAHRHGAIHRPFEIADPILERGLDPAWAVLAIGTVAGIVIGLLLLSERSLWRSIFHVAAAVLLLLIVLGTTQVVGLPPPPETGDGLSLRDGEGEGNDSIQRPSGPEFQDEYDQSGAQVPVAIVLLHDDYSPPTGVYYFRQDAFSQYNGHRMIATTMAGVDDDVAPGYPSTSLVQITNPPEAGRYRSTVETTVGMLADHPRPFGLESPIALIPSGNPDRTRFRRTYRVRSAVLTADDWALIEQPAGDPSWSAEIREHYTHGPADPRYGELARRIIADLPERYRASPYAQALAITNYLGVNGIYSLRSRHASAPDPTADFLFGDLTGYCVHFAHATTFLLRSIGLPARVATGYMVPESARQGGSAIMISGQGSHAWPEVYLDGVGWVVVDVAPERALDGAPSPPDEDLQQLLAELLRGSTPLPQDGSEPPRPLDQLARDLWNPFIRGLGIVLVTLLLLGYVIKIARRLAPGFAADGALPRLSYRAALDVLGEGGVWREAGESRELFAYRLRRELPSLTTLTDAHAAIAYQSRRRPKLEAVRAAASRLRGEHAKTVPLWRRLLGLADPFSWLHTR